MNNLEKSNSKLQKSKSTHSQGALDKGLEKFRKEIQSLSYKEALNRLDALLKELQDDSVAVEDLKVYYMKSTIYLDHCENLLSNLEQEVIQIDELN